MEHSTPAEAFTPAQTLDGSEQPYGFGWILDEYKGVPCALHGGEWQGFGSYILRFPSQQLSLYLLTNPSDANYEDLAFEIAALYLEDV